MVVITNPQNILREDDLTSHIEDDLIVNAIRNGHLVPMRWNDLTPEERLAAYAATFNPCGIC